MVESVRDTPEGGVEIIVKCHGVVKTTIIPSKVSPVNWMIRHFKLDQR
jgi:hypothetical protein